MPGSRVAPDVQLHFRRDVPPDVSTGMWLGGTCLNSSRLQPVLITRASPFAEIGQPFRLVRNLVILLTVRPRNGIWEGYNKF